MANKPAGFLVDTHLLLWWASMPEQLPLPARSRLESMDDPLFFSLVSLWEVAMLVERGRLELNMDLERWLAVASSPATVELARVTPAVAAEVARLPAGFHRDPADRLIVATARVRKLRVLTRDRMITQARVVPLWRAG
jgi:PIN domain nuclease of toxin-antitoxin system